MASAIKSNTSLTNLAGSTVAPSATGTSQWVNLTTTLEASVAGKVTWSGTLSAAPTLAVSVSPDNGTTVFALTTLTGPTSSPWNVPRIALPDDARYAQAALANNDGSITLTATFGCAHLDSIG